MNTIRTKIAGLICLLPTLLMGQESRELSLQNAIDSALQNNYGIIVQKINTDISEEQNNWGNAGALPSVSFSGYGAETWFSGDEYDYQNSYYSGSVDLSWTIFSGFSARISKEKLEEMEKLSEGNLSVIVENTLVSVMSYYYQALLNQEYIRIGQKLEGLSGDRYRYEEEKASLGASTTYNLLQAKNSWLEDQSSLLSAESNYRTAVRQLNYLMGAGLDNEYDLTEAFLADSGSYELAVLEERMLGNNFTLQNQYLNLKMAQLDVRQAKSSYYPTLALGASGGYSSSDTEYDYYYSDSNSTTAGWSPDVSATLSYTMYNGGVRKQALQVARLSEEISEVQTKDLEQEMRMTLRQELDLYEVRQKQLDLAHENQAAAELNLELSRERYKNGSINSFNFRDVQQIYMNAAVAYQNAIFKVIESHNTIVRLTGGIVDQYGE